MTRTPANRTFAAKFNAAAEAAGVSKTARYNPDNGLVTIPAEDFISLAWRAYGGGMQKDLVGFKNLSGAGQLAALRQNRKALAARFHVKEVEITAEDLARSLGVSYKAIRGHLLALAGDFAPKKGS